MKEIEILKQKLKKSKIIRLITIITLTISVILVPITAPKSTIAATIFTIIAITSIIIGLIQDKKIKILKYDIREISNITKGIKDSK